MWLRELHIRNFRKIEELKVTFPRGLCVIVGENNVGKTAIIDALRFILFSSRDYDSLRIREDDFRSGANFEPIEINCTFAELSEEDEVHFQECLIDIGGGKFDIRLNARAEFNETTRRVNVKMWGGETEGGSLPSNLYDRITAVYLKPLRDPESGLSPGRYSQVSRLIDCLTEEEQYVQFEKIAEDANRQIRGLKPVEQARDDINEQMVMLAGEELAQNTDLIFSDPKFHRIISGLQPKIDDLAYYLNGLGYNNIIFTSATLGTLRRSSQYSFRSILIEEPEAHLHPQLQVLLLRHFAATAADNGKNEVQVIASSHSPILASQAPIDSIVSVHEFDGVVNAISVSSINVDKILKRKLQRFLDATRGELFFARRILMVEGIAEALLLPELARIAGGDLKESAVTVLNADGINFNAFIPLLGEGRINIPVVILTDGDAKIVGDPPSHTAQGLKIHEGSIPNLRVSLSEITFEHELARSEVLLPYIQNAFRSLHPINGKKLDELIEESETNDDKANAFYEVFKDTKTSKGLFAQELAACLADMGEEAKAVPQYILDALRFLCVIPNEEDDD